MSLKALISPHSLTQSYSLKGLIIKDQTFLSGLTNEKTKSLTRGYSSRVQLNCSPYETPNKTSFINFTSPSYSSETKTDISQQEYKSLLLKRKKEVKIIQKLILI